MPPFKPGRAVAAALMRWLSRHDGQSPVVSRHVAQTGFEQSRQTATDGTAL